MTKYEEMCSAANNARKEFLDCQQRCWAYFYSIIGGLEDHCGVPKEKITYLKWNGQRDGTRRYLPAEPGITYTLPGAIDYDETDGFWHLGLRIVLGPDNVAPKPWVTFALCIKEQNQTPMVKVGIDGKPRTIFLDNENARNQYCEIITEEAVKAFSNPTEPGIKVIGFVTGTEAS
jgi:hypothetical protein